MPSITLPDYRLRIVRRKSVRHEQPAKHQAASQQATRQQATKEQATKRVPRPSILDCRLRGDPWVARFSAGSFAVCFNDQAFGRFAGTPLDGFTFNQLLHQLRHRYPRQS